MMILDSNVVSALMSDPPDQQVETWLDRQARASIWTTSVTLLEIQYGLKAMHPGRKQTMLIERFARILEKIEHRVAAFDEEAAVQAADLMASRKKTGKIVELRDTMIAGIVLAQRATLATRNITHFADISAPVLNPWTA